MSRVKIGDKIRAYRWDGSTMGEGTVVGFFNDGTPMLYIDAFNGRRKVVAAYGWEPLAKEGV